MAKPGRYARMQNKKSSPCTLALSLLLALSLVLLMLLALGILSLPSTSDGSSKANELASFLHKTPDSSDSEIEERGEQWTEILSWEPRAFIYHNFLSKYECNYLIDLAKPHMEKSTVVDTATGRSKDSRVRTSSGTFLKRGRDKIIRNIEKRIADFTFMPAGKCNGNHHLNL